MKIAHVITRLIIGGAQENTLFTVKGLLQKGHQVHLITGPTKGPEGCLEKSIENADAGLIVIPHLVREINPVADFLAFAQLLRLFQKQRYDIIHTHSAKAGILGRLAASLIFPRPLIVHTVHGPSFYPYQSALLRLFYTLAEKIAGFCTDYFICVGQVMKETYLKAGIGRPSQYRVIYSGFDLVPYQKAIKKRELIRTRLGVKEEEAVIGMIARLFPLKGQEYLLRSFAEIVRFFPRVKLLLVGDGILRKKLEILARQYKIEDKVIFAGLVSPEEIPGYVAAMDILAHTSLREGLPKAVAQGLAGGKPVVAFDVDGARELVKNGVTGYLVPAKDIQGLTERLISLLRQPRMAAAMGEKGRSLVQELFPVEKMVENIENLYLQGKIKNCRSQADML